MIMKDRLLLARRRLRHCNYILFGLIVALAAAWDQLKPLFIAFASRFVSPQNMDTLVAGIGLAVILIRVLAAFSPPKDDGEAR